MTTLKRNGTVREMRARDFRWFLQNKGRQMFQNMK